PIKSEQKVIGVLDIQSDEFDAFDETEVMLMETLADQVAVAIENARLYETVQQELTERKQAQDALRESEEKYRTILENIEDGYYEVDTAGNFTFFNDSICKILGYPRDELMGMNNRQYTEKENAKKLYQTFNRVYKTEKPTRIFDWEIIRKDNTKGHVEASVSLMKDAEGQRKGFRGIVRDITEKKNLEAQLLQAQKMEAIGTLAGGIAHNFNNLLMSIQGNTSLMLLDTDSNHPHYQRLTNIEKLVQSGSKLTSQLLGYARGGRYEVKPISMNQIIKEASATFSMTKKDITIHQDLDKDLYGVKADLGQIEQVLLNIYVNAAEAMPGGGDLFLHTINVTHKDIKKKPYKVKPGEYILLTIRDTGIGMDKNTKDKVFDPFFTTKGLAKGTGLGLASVYGIIKAHGGYIDVESKKGHGTTFYIYLPASKETVVEEKKKVAELLKGKETVLLVDDEEIILDVGQELLKTLGYKVLIVKGGREAIEIVSKAHRAKRKAEEGKEHYAPGAMPPTPDIVILDMIMPVIGGGETYDRMKEINPDIKVLLSSGYSINGQATEILKRGCDGFIQKPFTMRELSKAIRGVLEKK
ncbi:MAG: oxidoreductase, partial [Deltaproteobacteria bacterium]